MQLCTSVVCAMEGGFQESLDIQCILLGCLWQQDRIKRSHYMGVKEYKTVSCFGTKKKTLQNLSKFQKPSI